MSEGMFNLLAAVKEMEKSRRSIGDAMLEEVDGSNGIPSHDSLKELCVYLLENDHTDPMTGTNFTMEVLDELYQDAYARKTESERT